MSNVNAIGNTMNSGVFGFSLSQVVEGCCLVEINIQNIYLNSYDIPELVLSPGNEDDLSSFLFQHTRQKSPVNINLKIMDRNSRVLIFDINLITPLHIFLAP